MQVAIWNRFSSTSAGDDTYDEKQFSRQYLPHVRRHRALDGRRFSLQRSMPSHPTMHQWTLESIVDADGRLAGTFTKDMS